MISGKCLPAGVLRFVRFEQISALHSKRLACGIKLPKKVIGLYSVMQSDGNSFWGDVVSDSFKKTSQDEDNISDKMN